MKASEFIGMKVLDKEVNEVGKVAEFSIKLKKCLVDKIFISTGGSLSKKYFVIVEDDIADIGDYVQLKLDKEAIDLQVKVDKVDDFVKKGSRLKDLMGKVVLSQDGMEIGKITDMVIEPRGCLIQNVIIKNGTPISKKYLMISDEDISEIGDYMILKLKKKDLEQKIIV